MSEGIDSVQKRFREGEKHSMFKNSQDWYRESIAAALLFLIYVLVNIMNFHNKLIDLLCILSFVMFISWMTYKYIRRRVKKTH